MIPVKVRQEILIGTKSPTPFWTSSLFSKVLECVVSDSFRFKFCNFRPLTRGGILSVTGSIFDPLGFHAFFVLTAKEILQDLCRIKLGWDDEIPDEDSSRWGSWLADLLKFSIFIVSRCLKPADFGQIKYSQLHHFSLFFPFWQIVFVRQDKMIKTELDMPLNVNSLFWTYRRPVLRYVKNESMRFHTFVPNRIAKIRDGSTPHRLR